MSGIGYGAVSPEPSHLGSAVCGREQVTAAEGEIARNLSGKRTATGHDTLESRGLKPRAEGVSAADRVPVARVSQASDRGAQSGRESGRERVRLEEK